jgi:DNA-binding transcriptional ArsR family regulator
MESPLRPTLWRTCRALANLRRLRILALLAQDPGQTVSSVALRLGLPVAVASQYLRALEARSLLSVRRIGRQVQYRLRTIPEERHPLVQPLQSALRRDEKAVERIFQLCTAFTHPRRIEIFAALKKEPHRLGRLQVVTHISVRALERHLEKLSARGFVRLEQGWYFAAVPAGAVARTLAVLAER